MRTMRIEFVDGKVEKYQVTNFNFVDDGLVLMIFVDAPRGERQNDRFFPIANIHSFGWEG